MPSLPCAVCQNPIAPPGTGAIFWNPAPPLALHDYCRKSRESYRSRASLDRVIPPSSSAGRTSPLSLLRDVLETPGQSWSTVKPLFDELVKLEFEIAKEGHI
jgi:hypothetical protein